MTQEIETSSLWWISKWYESRHDHEHFGSQPDKQAGFVRAAIVSVLRGTSCNFNQRLRRPIQHLIPTEVQPWSVSSLNFSKTDFFLMKILQILSTELFKDKCLSHIYFM